jgi:hypothetical protein
MKVSLAGNLVATVNDFSDHFGLMFGDPTKDEKGRFRIGLVEEIERQVGVTLNAAFEPMPVTRVQNAPQSSRVTIVFHDDR